MEVVNGGYWDDWQMIGCKRNCVKLVSGVLDGYHTHWVLVLHRAGFWQPNVMTAVNNFQNDEYKIRLKRQNGQMLVNN